VASWSAGRFAPGDGAPVLGHDRAADVRAQPRAVSPARLAEALEDPGAFLRRYAWAVVAHRDPHGVALRPDLDLDRRVDR
jgi:hypothetical protein